MNQLSRHDNRIKRARRVRAVVTGTAGRPRLSVFRSLSHINVQLIDDEAQKTLVAISDKALTGKPIEKATQVGQKVAELAKARKISTVVFDRAGNKYHGRVAALATAARTAGLKF